VINFTTMAIAAELRAKIDLDKLAFQLHYLGRWYGTAERLREGRRDRDRDRDRPRRGVIIPLRDGREGRPKYSNLYYHRRSPGRTTSGPKQPGSG
jgi:hypothetical protein